MTKTTKSHNLKYLGIAGLILPPISIYLALMFPRVLASASDFYLFLAFYFGLPIFTGIYLLVKFILQKREKSIFILFLSILNLLSLFWLLVIFGFYFLGNMD